MLSNNVEFLKNVEYCRIMPNIDEQCRKLSNIAEYCRILSKNVAVLSEGGPH